MTPHQDIAADGKGRHCLGTFMELGEGMKERSLPVGLVEGETTSFLSSLRNEADAFLWH